MRLRLLALAALLFSAAPSQACVGTACLQIWSTEAAGGALTIQWHFDEPKLHMGVFCTGGECLYSTVDPGFITTADTPPQGYFGLADDTAVRVEIVALDAGTTLKIDGIALNTVGASTALGAAPTLHAHPFWQLKLPQATQGDFSLSFRLVSGSAQYADSEVYTVVLTTEPGPTMTATASPTPTPTQAAPAGCAGDCNIDGLVTIDELVRGVTLALSGGSALCNAMDTNGDGTISINELIAAVNNALAGCTAVASPTPTQRPATFAEIQQAIFAPRCAIATCHDDEFESGDLNLTADAAYDALVGVEPDIESAATAGFLRVDAGHPDKSFLLIKLTGPPIGQGSRMPLTGAPLSAEEIQLIRDWIAAGASPS